MILFENNTFVLENDTISYCFKITDFGELNHLYFGKKIGKENLDLLQPKITRSVISYIGNAYNSMGYMKNEFPSNFGTDYGNSAISINFDGSNYSHFKYFSHEVGKSENEVFSSLFPSFCKNSFEVLKVTLKETLTDIFLNLYYYISKEGNVIIKRSELFNGSKKEITVNKLYSSSVDFSDSNYDLKYFNGTWVRERELCEDTINFGLKKIYSKTGCSSANTNPFFMLSDKNADEFNGNSFGFNLVYSGNFENIIERSNYNRLRIQQGIFSEDFAYELSAGETFYTPEAVIAFSDKGTNGLSHEMHKVINEHLLPKTRIADDVLINNWEATYFNFDEDKLMNLAKEAKEVGVSLFVLDDGWFGKRNDDTTSLGDWEVNTLKLKSGIDGLCKNINSLGMKFGLWIEPEMTNVDSKTYEEHSEYVLYKEGYDQYLGRNQLVLDFANPEVVDYIYNKIKNTISTCNVEYIKWDMNRYITHPSTDTYKNSHNYHYILGVYSFYRKLMTDFPNIVIEGCASGGGRFDLGILAFSPQIWLSDNTDAQCRFDMQYNTSIAYPISTFGSHVSDIPNHQTNREISLITRGNIAYFGSFGYELDINKVSEDDKKIIKKQISFYRENAELIKTGRFYRLCYKNDYSPFSSWAVNKNNETIVLIYLEKLTANMPIFTVKIPFLDRNKKYECLGTTYTGAFLIEKGIILSSFFTGNNMSDLFSGHSLEEIKQELQDNYLEEPFIRDNSSIVFKVREVK